MMRRMRGERAVVARLTRRDRFVAFRHDPRRAADVVPWPHSQAHVFTIAVTGQWRQNTRVRVCARNMPWPLSPDSPVP